MSTTEQTLACPVCGRPYKVYAFRAGDQSACARCVSEAEGGSTNPFVPNKPRPSLPAHQPLPIWIDPRPDTLPRFPDRPLEVTCGM